MVGDLLAQVIEGCNFILAEVDGSASVEIFSVFITVDGVFYFCPSSPVADGFE